MSAVEILRKKLRHETVLNIPKIISTSLIQLFIKGYCVMGISGAILNLRLVFCGHINYRIVVMALALPLMISGCASVRGYPERLIEADVALKDVRDIYKQDNIKACDVETDEAKKIACRNNILSAGMIGIDINFSEFERKLFKEGREASFVTTVATLGLTTAGAMTGTAVLSGIATGIVGSKEAFDKEILLDQAKNAIHTQMRALRQTVANRIRYGMTRPFDEYPLDTALIDIEEYYNAGTLLGAYVGITASAGQQIEESEVNKDRVAIGKEPLIFSPLVSGGVTAGKIITQPISPYSGKEETDTKKVIKECMKDDRDNVMHNNLKNFIKEHEIKDKDGLDVLPFIFKKGDNLEQERTLFIKEFCTSNNR